MIFAYTFLVVFVALVVILGLGSLLTRGNETPEIIPEGAATAAMCTTQLLGRFKSDEKTRAEFMSRIYAPR